MSNDLEMNFLLMFTMWASRGCVALFYMIIQRGWVMGALFLSIAGFWGHPGSPLPARRERKRTEMCLQKVDMVQAFKWHLFPPTFPGYSSVTMTYLLKRTTGEYALAQEKQENIDLISNWQQ